MAQWLGVGEVRRRRLTEALGGAGDLRGAELHVVLPDRLRVERVRECGDQRPRWGLGVRAGVERLSLVQLVQCLCRVSGGIGLGGEREGRRHAAGEVRADRPAGRRGVEDRAVRDVPVQRVGVVVVGLGQPPEVVVAGERALFVARPDADLHVQRAGLLVPHLVQPGEAVPGLREQARGRARPQEPGAGEEDDVVVRRGVGELQVVTGVGPAALDVDRPADPGEVLVGDEVLAAHHVRPRVDVGLGVEQVRRPTVQRPRHHLVAVALVLVERDAVPNHRCEQLPCRCDLEPRRGGAHRAVRLHAIATPLVQGAEIEPVDGRVRGAPARVRRCPDVAAEHDLAVLVDDPERRRTELVARHQCGPLRLPRQPPLLVHPQHRAHLGGRGGTRPVGRGGTRPVGRGRRASACHETCPVGRGRRASACHETCPVGRGGTKSRHETCPVGRGRRASACHETPGVARRNRQDEQRCRHRDRRTPDPACHRPTNR